MTFLLPLKHKSLRTLFAASALALGLSTAARADSYSLLGTITTDDQVSFFALSLPTTSQLSITSIGYAGGTAIGGVVIPRGGFDSMLFLYNSSGALVAQSDDGIGVPTDPITRLAADAAFSVQLPSGSYTLAVTQYDNFAMGNLSAGFSQAGHGNFTPSLSGNCTAIRFCDSSGASRTGNWAVNVITTAVPEPSSAAFLLVGLGAMVLIRRSKKQTV